MTKKLSLLFTCIPIALLCGLISGCGGKSAPQGSTLDRIREQGVVRIGYANEAPYAYEDTSTGKLTGESPEIAKMVLKDLGVTEVEGILTEFGSLIPGLKAGRFDVIAAGMYIKPKRCKEIAFSNPTYAIGEAFAVRKDNPLGLHSYEDVKANPEVKLGVVAGAVERDYASQMGIPQNQVMVFPDAPSALAGVRIGRVDAYGGTALTVQDLLSKDNSGELERAEPFANPIIAGKEILGYGAFGFRKQDVELREAFNDRLATFIGSAEHLNLVAPFGFTAQELPGDITAEDLCGATTAGE